MRFRRLRKDGGKLEVSPGYIVQILDQPGLHCKTLFANEQAKGLEKWLGQ